MWVGVRLGVFDAVLGVVGEGVSVRLRGCVDFLCDMCVLCECRMWMDQCVPFFPYGLDGVVVGE